MDFKSVIETFYTCFQKDLRNATKELKEHLDHEIAALKIENKMNEKQRRKEISDLDKRFEKKMSSLRRDLEKLQEEHEEFKWETEFDAKFAKARTKRISESIFDLRRELIMLELLGTTNRYEMNEVTDDDEDDDDKFILFRSLFSTAD